MNSDMRQDIEEFFDEISNRFLNYNELVEIDYINIFFPYQSIKEVIKSPEPFLFEEDAIRFLAKFDKSLKISLNIAKEYGYTLEDLDSITLAALLRMQLIEKKLEEDREKIEGFFKNLRIKYRKEIKEEYGDEIIDY